MDINVVTEGLNPDRLIAAGVVACEKVEVACMTQRIQPSQQG